MCLRPFGLYCSAYLGILFVSILCMYVCMYDIFIIYLLYDIFINCSWVVTRWQYTFTHKQYRQEHK